ncbi:hypothetical protein SAMN04488025_11214 [Planifilum fulgidum]|uniref:Uncharacterized protein n=1 Tax=Planifilum fulgidum TaxID=201973 RepID=A0A1I2NA82_9BACL|nr:hypothetical protein SAMN04488025_11214 [Planifilum fulgidum]
MCVERVKHADQLPAPRSAAAPAVPDSDLLSLPLSSSRRGSAPQQEKGRHSASMEKRWQTSLVPSREKVRSMKVTSPFARMIKTEEERVP